MKYLLPMLVVLLLLGGTAQAHDGCIPYGDPIDPAIHTLWGDRSYEDFPYSSNSWNQLPFDAVSDEFPYYDMSHLGWNETYYRENKTMALVPGFCETVYNDTGHDHYLCEGYEPLGNIAVWGERNLEDEMIGTMAYLNCWGWSQPYSDARCGYTALSLRSNPSGSGHPSEYIGMIGSYKFRIPNEDCTARPSHPDYGPDSIYLCQDYEYMSEEALALTHQANCWDPDKSYEILRDYIISSKCIVLGGIEEIPGCTPYYDPSPGGAGASIPVPEPGAVISLISGATMMALMNHRRKKNFPE
jgi:hypothetical protein